MSRIGKIPVEVPSGVTCTIDGQTVTAKGPKGELTRSFSDLVTISQQEGAIKVEPVGESHEANAQHGLVRTLISNMVQGVSAGFEKKLQLVGVGYRATLKGRNLELALGYSHPVVVEAEEGITFEVPDNTHISVKGISKRPPEPYKGKGIRYEGEHVRRKLGKAAK